MNDARDSSIGPNGPRADAARERFWRSIDEAQSSDAAAKAAPMSSSEAKLSTPALHDRRNFMKILGASLALAGAGCARAPLEKIVPYRDGPAQQTYGKPVYYASTLVRDGYGLGVLVATQMGRPTKIEGNPHHPASLGATDVFAQAAVLELWDPDRSQTVRQGDAIGTWNGFVAALQSATLRSGSNRGRGLRILTDAVTSPSLHAQIDGLLARFPEARWHQWQPLNRDNAYAGARLAFGAPFETIYRFERARVVLALDADFLDAIPGCVRYARDFSARRGASVARRDRSRLYAIECVPSLTGAAADHRLPLRGSEIAEAARSIVRALDGTEPLPDAWLGSVVADLKAARGESIVVAGERQPPIVHALAHAINDRLGNIGKAVILSTPVIAEPIDQLESIRDLARDMRNGDVDALVIAGANPVYDAPVDLAFAQALERVAFKVHHGLYVDETAARCDWHVPAAHPLESWGDVRGFDGTISLQQPCIAPLYGGRSTSEFFAAVAGDVAPNGHELLRGAWSGRTSGAVDGSFEDALRIGVVSGSAFPPELPALRSDFVAPRGDLPIVDSDTLELVFTPDPRIGDGRHANNTWLQELPKPLSQLAWDNAALIAPALAQQLHIENEDVVELRVGGRALTVPAWVMSGMPDTSVALALGYGRSRAGSVGSERGANAYALRASDAPWLAQHLTIAATGARHHLACAQTHGRMEGRDIVRSYTAAQAAECTAKTCGTRDYRDARTLYDSPATGPYAWAMSIDLSSCIGCGACTIACQAENNIPVVGKDEMMSGREMHWIRVDRYYAGPVRNPRAVFQPVPCMQCEHAPCEVVCPVEASVHDAQGINVQVYNRCVGTRFCSNNCPYKVRRFNFLQYSKDTPGLAAQRNPEVTVRMRGVMEKCNYCLQRITTAKIGADRERRNLGDGEIVTACQAVCPTRAIVFGDLNDPRSDVSRCKQSPLDYALLADLNTRPRTTYLVRITNPSPRLERSGAAIEPEAHRDG